MQEPTLFEKIAISIAKQIELNLAKKNKVSLAMCGGRSAAAVCDALCTLPIQWNNVHIFMIDERLVPIDNAESNFKIIHDHILLKTQIPSGNAHPFIYDTDVASIERYTQEFSNFSSSFDIVFLSAGEDGHVAGLYPHHPILLVKDKPFVAFHDSPKPPSDRMTATPLVIAKAGCVVLLFYGKAKQEAYLQFIKEGSISECPARLAKEARSALIFKDFAI